MHLHFKTIFTENQKYLYSFFFFNDLNVGTSLFSFFLSRPALAFSSIGYWFGKGEKQLALKIGSSQFALLKLPNL